MCGINCNYVVSNHYNPNLCFSHFFQALSALSFSLENLLPRAELLIFSLFHLFVVKGGQILFRQQIHMVEIFSLFTTLCLSSRSFASPLCALFIFIRLLFHLSVVKGGLLFADMVKTFLLFSAVCRQGKGAPFSPQIFFTGYLFSVGRLSSREDGSRSGTLLHLNLFISLDFG